MGVLRVNARVSEKAGKTLKKTESFFAEVIHSVILMAAFFGIYYEAMSLWVIVSGEGGYEFEAFMKNILHIIIYMEVIHIVFLFLKKESILHIIKALLVLLFTAALRTIVIKLEYQTVVLATIAVSLTFFLVICYMENKMKEEKKVVGNS